MHTKYEANPYERVFHLDDINPYLKLGGAIVCQAMRDYEDALKNIQVLEVAENGRDDKSFEYRKNKSTIIECERFFKSELCSLICPKYTEDIIINFIKNKIKKENENV